MLQMMITILFHDLFYGMYSYYNIIIFVIEQKNKGANDKQLARYSK